VTNICGVGHAPVTVHGNIVQLRAWLRWLVTAGAPHGLDKTVPHVPRPSARERVLTPNELQLLLELATPWMALAMLLLHDCGLRAGTMVRVTWANIEGDVLTMRTKRSVVTRVPLSGRLRQMLQFVPKGSAPLIALARGKPTARPAWEHGWRELIKASGIEGLRPHDFRRTMARKVYQLTGDLRVSQQLLGHAVLSSTLHYMGTSGGEGVLRSAVDEVTAHDKK
jgi:integrase